MSVINAKSPKVKLIRFGDLTVKELNLIGNRNSTVYKVDYQKISELYGGKVDGADFGYARISFQGKTEFVGQILVPVLPEESEELWSILFCPPGKITGPGELVFCQNDEELENSLYGQSINV